MQFESPLVTLPDFGRLTYRSGYWRGALLLPAFDSAFDVIVRAKREGPSPEQRRAMAALVLNAASIRHAATRGMADLHRRSGLLPAGHSPDGIWHSLQPEQIEVTAASYYGDGRIAILLIFGSTLNQDFAPAIETADGQFVQVLSGT